jgi:hypothetical protein
MIIRLRRLPLAVTAGRLRPEMRWQAERDTAFAQRWILRSEIVLCLAHSKTIDNRASFGNKAVVLRGSGKSAPKNRHEASGTFAQSCVKTPKLENGGSGGARTRPAVHWISLETQLFPMK